MNIYSLFVVVILCFHRGKLSRKMHAKNIPSSCLEEILQVTRIVSLHSELCEYILGVSRK